MNGRIQPIEVANSRRVGDWLLRRMTGGPEWLLALGHSRRDLLLANLGWLASLGLVFATAVSVQIAPPRALLLAIGIATAYLAVRKPWWFWQHPDLVSMRARLSDSVVWSLYLAIALAALVASMVGV